MQDTERKLPCISHSCKFEGVRLKRAIYQRTIPKWQNHICYIKSKTFVCCQERPAQSHAKPNKNQQELSKTQHEKPSQKKQAISVTLSSATHWETPIVSTALVKEKKKMPKTSTSDIRLSGVAPDTTPSKYQELIVLRYNIENRNFDIENSIFRYHYDSANEVIIDFESFERSFSISKLSYYIRWYID